MKLDTNYEMVRKYESRQISCFYNFRNNLVFRIQVERL